MQSDIYNTLSDNARKLVNQIEKRVGYEIQVQPKSARKDGWISEVSDENVVGVVSGPDSIVIESPGGGDIAEVDFIHELLHLQRLYVFEVPHLWPKKQPMAMQRPHSTTGWSTS